ncbi:GlcG/HbpS family heme-binding protein [Methylobacillus sp. Pita1]|uniref:GlcG/HbpS family heme-binding protein n=1 Tax=Methylobacillus sp. Pita1 TaxID=3382642 RepID=UPI0038B61ABF
MKRSKLFNTIAWAGFLSAAVALNAAENTPQQPAPGGLPGIPLELAQEAARASIESCARKDGLIGVSIIDSAGVLKVLLAADGATPRGVSSSTAKAQTALAFGVDTSYLHEHVETDKALAARVAGNPAYNSRPGGVLIKANGQVLGAIGIGGAKIDEECALAGLEKIQSRL